MSKVLVYPREVLDGLGFKGVYKGPFLKDYLEEIIEDSFYWDRTSAETDESLRQIIPYMLIRRNNEVFRYQRGRSGSEGRLHDLWSIGVGGHIEPLDGQAGEGETFEKAYLRELLEEVEVPQILSVKPRALINDETDEVGRVHTGVALEVRIPYRGFFVKENCLRNGEFVNTKSIRQLECEWEGWSRLLIEELF